MVDHWSLGDVWIIGVNQSSGTEQYRMKCRWCSWNNYGCTESTYKRAVQRLLSHVKSMHATLYDRMFGQLRLWND